MEAGSILNIGYDRVLETVADGTSVQAVFSDQEDVIEMLRTCGARYGHLDRGSGPGGTHRRVCTGLGHSTPHLEHSLGVWGRTDLLPDPDIMSITTMCGHGLIAVSLVKDAVEKMRNGKMTMDKAIAQICRPCICGMTNPVRLERVLTRLVEARSS